MGCARPVQYVHDARMPGRSQRSATRPRKPTYRSNSPSCVITATTTQEVHEDAVEIMELTQHAKAQYTDADMGNDAKRTILTKLFDEIVYVGGSVSVKLSFLAESIAKRSDETRQIMETQKVLNQTAKNDEINSGQENKIDLKNEIYPVWQGLKDDYRTYCDVASFLEKRK